jgi:hypothetical protein
VVSSTVTPSRSRERISSHVLRRLSGSRPVVGSSRNSTSGLPSNASARSSRRRSPPESCFTRTEARCARSTRVSASSTGRGDVSVPAHIRAASATVRSGGKPPSCNITPIRGRTDERSVNGSWPSTRTVPSAGRESPSTTSTVEVFPAPFVPSRANISPRSTSKDTPRTASNPPLYRRVSPRTSIAVIQERSRATPAVGSAVPHQFPMTDVMAARPAARLAIVRLRS